MDLCIDMRVDTCIDMCMDMCIEMCCIGAYTVISAKGVSTMLADFGDNAQAYYLMIYILSY